MAQAFPQRRVSLRPDDVSLLTGKPISQGILPSLRNAAGPYAPPQPTMTNQYAQAVQQNGLMTNGQAAAYGGVPMKTVGGNFGQQRPAFRGLVDAVQQNKALTNRFLAPDFNADGRYFQGATLGTNAQGRPTFTDAPRAPQYAGGAATPTDAAARSVGLLQAMANRGLGYFDDQTGRFIGSAPENRGASGSPSAAASALMGNDFAQRSAAVAGRVTPSLANVTQQPSQLEQRQALAQQLVTQRAQQRASERAARMRGPSLEDMIVARNPQLAPAFLQAANQRQQLQQQAAAENRRIGLQELVAGQNHDIAQQQLAQGDRHFDVTSGLQRDELTAKRQQVAGEQANKSLEVGLASVIQGVQTGQFSPQQAVGLLQLMQQMNGQPGGQAGGLPSPQVRVGGAQPSAPIGLGNLPPAGGPLAAAQPSIADFLGGGKKVHYGVEMTDKQKERIDAVKDDPQAVVDVLTREMGLSEEQANIALNRLYGTTARSVQNPTTWGAFRNWIRGTAPNPGTGAVTGPAPYQRPGAMSGMPMGF